MMQALAVSGLHIVRSELTERPDLEGIQIRIYFENNRGASIIKHKYSYGGPEGYWELGVLDNNDSLDYTTPVTGDVLGYLEDSEVMRYLRWIDNLLPIRLALPAPQLALPLPD